MSEVRRRWLALLTIGAVLTVGSAACGGSAGAGQSAESLLQSAPGALSAVHTFRITMAGQVTTSGQPTMALSGTGLVDWSTGDASLQLDQASQTDQVTVLNGTTYVRSSDLLGQLGVAKSWLEIPATGAGQSSATTLEAVDPIGDPITSIASLRTDLTHVVVAGHRTIDGADTTQLNGAFSNDNSPFLQGGRGTASVWIDKQGRIRQVKVVGTSAGDTITLTETFTDFGLPVTVTAPPAGEVETIAQVQGGAPATAGTPTAEGGWSTAAHGQTAGVRWKVLVAHATNSGECLTVVTDPSLGNIEADFAADGSSSDSDGPGDFYRGYPANCAPIPTAADVDEGNTVVQPLDADSLEQSGSGPHYVAGVLLSQITGLTANLSDGRTVPVTVTNGVFFAAWTQDASLSQLNVISGGPVSCEGANQAGSIDVTAATCP